MSRGLKWRELGNVPLEVYEREFARKGSPMLAEVRAVWRAARPHSLLCLAQMGMESQYGIDGIATQGTHNPLGLRPRGGDGFQRFGTWAEAVAEWKARITDHGYAYPETVTLEEYIHVYAPGWDGNDEAAYVGFIEGYVTRFGSPSPIPDPPSPGKVPYPPMLERPIVKVVGVGRDPDQTRTPVVGTVVHTMDGTLWGTDGWFRRPDVPALTDYGIGQDGTIIKWNGTDWQVGWASGPARSPNGDGARLVARFGTGGVNRFLRSIEHEGDQDDPVSEAMWRRSCWLQAAIHAEEAGQTADSYDWNLHHYEFTGKDYKVCPGTRFFSHTDAYQAFVRAIMRHYQHGAPLAPFYAIAGVRVGTDELPPSEVRPPAEVPPIDPVEPGGRKVWHGTVIEQPSGRIVIKPD